MSLFEVDIEFWSTAYYISDPPVNSKPKDIGVSPIALSGIQDLWDCSTFHQASSSVNILPCIIAIFASGGNENNAG